MKFVSTISAHRLNGREQRMVHRGDAGVVDEHVQPAFQFADFRKHFLHCRLVAHIQTVVTVVGQLTLEGHRLHPMTVQPAAA